jgi:pimeloyl-ACP methyl ester carboxylesterase
LEAMLPQAWLVQIPEAGHMVPITHPEDVFRAMG